MGGGTKAATAPLSELEESAETFLSAVDLKKEVRWLARRAVRGFPLSASPPEARALHSTQDRTLPPSPHSRERHGWVNGEASFVPADGWCFGEIRYSSARASSATSW